VLQKPKAVSAGGIFGLLGDRKQQRLLRNDGFAGSDVPQRDQAEAAPL
jgi:hypothetical protein